MYTPVEEMRSVPYGAADDPNLSLSHLKDRKRGQITSL